MLAITMWCSAAVLLVSPATKKLNVSEVSSQPQIKCYKSNLCSDQHFPGFLEKVTVEKSVLILYIFFQFLSLVNTAQNAQLATPAALVCAYPRVKMTMSAR